MELTEKNNIYELTDIYAFNLYHKYLYGDSSIERNPEKAVELLENLIDSQSIRIRENARKKLAMCYAIGYGVDKDIDKAIVLFCSSDDAYTLKCLNEIEHKVTKFALSEDSKYACKLDLAMLTLFEEEEHFSCRTEPFHKEALSLLYEVADKEDWYAVKFLASSYEEGNFYFEKDIGKAVEYYKKMPEDIVIERNNKTVKDKIEELEEQLKDNDKNR